MMKEYHEAVRSLNALKYSNISIPPKITRTWPFGDLQAKKRTIMSGMEVRTNDATSQQ